MIPDTVIYLQLQIIYLLGFTLHNIEEAIWLPRWAGGRVKHFKKIGSDGFIFAVIMITAIGYLLTAINSLFGSNYFILNYLYNGFIGMMLLNIIFPHLLSAVVFRTYAPGLLTGVLLNLPLGGYIVYYNISVGMNIGWFIWSLLGVSIVSLLIIFLCYWFSKIIKNSLS